MIIRQRSGLKETKSSHYIMNQLNAASVKGGGCIRSVIWAFSSCLCKVSQSFSCFFWTHFVIPAFGDKLSARPVWARTGGGLGKLYSCEWKGGLTGVSRVLPSVVSLNHCFQTLARPSLSLARSLSGLWILSIAFSRSPCSFISASSPVIPFLYFFITFSSLFWSIK